MSVEWPDYELIDFGEGRKLERFGAWVFDRPCPIAQSPKRLPEKWGLRTSTYLADNTAESGWSPALGSDRLLDRMALDVGRIDCRVPVGAGFKFWVSPRPGGQVGLFPEQFDNWRWIARQVERLGGINVLNLFAYTGGSTMAATVVGAQVTHVDAAKPIVQQASTNAEVSGLADRPIRWITEDAMKYCRREVRRGNLYDAVILDPPTYGHGPKGEEWLIRRDLLPLLELCGELTERRPKFVLLTCHTPGIGPAELAAYLSDGVFGHCGQPPRTGELCLQTADGRRLPSGVFARWPA